MSIRDEWETPIRLFNALDREFNFTLDVCATDDNAKCGNHYNKADDGLSRRWQTDTYAFCNPPYSNILPWVKKAVRELADGNKSVLLLPNDPSTEWFAECKKNAAEIRFIVGKRVQFDAPKGVQKSSNTGTNIVVVFRQREATTMFWEYVR